MTAYPSAVIRTFPNSSPFSTAWNDVPSGWYIRNDPFVAEEALTTTAARIIVNMDKNLLLINEKAAAFRG